MESAKLIEKANHYGANNYLPLDVVLQRGEGAQVWDVDGKEYLDFLSSYSAVNFGHSNPRLTRVLQAQANKLAVCSRAFQSEELCLFVESLAQFCGYERVLPMNSGSEAVETAIKLARKWGYKKRGIAEGTIIAMENNFHGRTITIVSFSTEALYREGFGPFTPGFKTVPFNSIESLKSVIDDKTIAVIAEPIQAEAGILIPDSDFLPKVRNLCQENEILLMLDEIQTGLGRTGKNFCFEHSDTRPDVLILGKSLGGGLLPLSAVVTGNEIMDVIEPGEHGSTFGGNPLACAIGREAIQILEDDALSSRSAKLGQQAIERLQQENLSGVKEVRGRGLLIGIELNTSARPACERLAVEGVLCKETHDTVLRIAPPLTIPEERLNAGIDKIVQVLNNT